MGIGRFTIARWLVGIHAIDAVAAWILMIQMGSGGGTEIAYSYFLLFVDPLTTICGLIFDLLAEQIGIKWGLLVYGLIVESIQWFIVGRVAYEILA